MGFTPAQAYHAASEHPNNKALAVNTILSNRALSNVYLDPSIEDYCTF